MSKENNGTLPENFLNRACDFCEIGHLHDTKRTRVSYGTLKGRTVVLKRFKVVDENSIQRFENELKLLLILSSKSRYILQPVGAVKDAPVYGILEPFCELGSLGILLHAAKAKQWPSGKIEDRGENPCILSAPARICAAHDLICAVSYCHTESIIIRDIKPENMLVELGFVCKLADLELGMTLEQSRQPRPEHKGGPASKPRFRFEGTPAYLAPEVILAFLQQRESPATFASDVYSVGIALNEIASNQVPYADAHLREDQWQQNTVIESRYSPNQFYAAVCCDSDPLRPSPPKDASGCPSLQALAVLARSCWAHDPTQRPRAEEILAQVDAACSSVDTSPEARRRFAAEAAALIRVGGAPEPMERKMDTGCGNEQPEDRGAGFGGRAGSAEDWRLVIQDVAGVGEPHGGGGAGDDGPWMHAAADGLMGRRETMEDRRPARCVWRFAIELLIQCGRTDPGAGPAPRG